MSDDRTPTDGRPFYCQLCGLGFSEFLACEEAWCKLESLEAAQMRQQAKIVKPRTKRKAKS